MDTRQLTAFCAVVDRRSFSQAAEQLGVTQPAVSLQIRSLEKRLGQRLLDRSGRRGGLGTVQPLTIGGGGDDDPRPRVRDHEGDPVGRVRGVDGYECGPRHRHRPHRRHRFHRPAHTQRHNHFRAGAPFPQRVGETIAERRAGQAETVILRQIDAALTALAAAKGGFLLAYEPVWAIGTGETATPKDASAAQGALRARLRERLGKGADGVPILYGGSVNAQNVRSLLDAKGVDGVLVGGASLDAEGWATIVRS